MGERIPGPETKTVGWLQLAARLDPPALRHKKSLVGKGAVAGQRRAAAVKARG